MSRPSRPALISTSTQTTRHRIRDPRARAATPFGWLGALLTLYLCAPFVASLPRIVGLDWTAVDWHPLIGAAGISAASATLSAVVIAIGGIPLAYWLSRRPSRHASVIGFIVQLPLALPPLTSGILLLFLLGPYSAIGNWTNTQLTDSFTGILLAGVFVAAPFLIVAARSAFGAVDPLLEDVAATLGHHAYARFFRVALPLAWPAIRAGLLLAWLRAFGEFGATVMVAYHPYSLPVYTYVAFGSQGLPAMMPIVLPTLTIAMIAAVLSALSARSPRRLAASALPPANDAITAYAPTVPPSTQVHPHASVRFAFEKKLADFDLNIAWAPQARRLAIIGESGSGKSMTLRLLAGLEAADHAFFSIDTRGDGNAPKTPEHNLAEQDAEDRHLAYVPQDYGLFPHMTVERQWSFARDTDMSAARAWAEKLGVAHLMERYPAQLSIGQRQRVAIVRALARPCPLILLDEPFSALDTPRRRQLQASLRALQGAISATTIVVTHDPDEAAYLADELLVIDAGRVLQQGPTHALMARPANMAVARLLGLSNIGTAIVTDDGLIDMGGGAIAWPNAQAGERNDTLAAGAAVMWRIDPAAICITQAPPTDAALTGTVIDYLLIDGRHHIQAQFGTAVLRRRATGKTYQDAPPRDATPGTRIHITIAPWGIDVWPLQA